MTLRDWQMHRLPALKRMTFPRSSYADDLTVVAYSFPPEDREDEMFAWLACAILQTWSVLGEIKTILVANREFNAVREFVSAHPSVELQLAPDLVPGNLKTMSLDCIKSLHTRFQTPYCLVVQDDGFPFRDNLGDFLGRYDYVGAPIISDGWKRRIAYALRLGSFNGGFSLRSRALCEHASRKWYAFFSKFMPEDHRHLGEDFYYTTLLKALPSTWLHFRYPSESVAFRFAVDTLEGHVLPPQGLCPSGFHGKSTAAYLLSHGLFPPLEIS